MGQDLFIAAHFPCGTSHMQVCGCCDHTHACIICLQLYMYNIYMKLGKSLNLWATISDIAHSSIGYYQYNEIAVTSVCGVQCVRVSACCICTCTDGGIFCVVLILKGLDALSTEESVSIFGVLFV